MPWRIFPAAEFNSHATAWDALARRLQLPPFLESHFVEPLLRHFGSGRELLALDLQRDVLLAGAVLQPVGRGMWQTFQPSQMPLGPWLAAPEDDLAERARKLIGALPGWATGLGVTQLDPAFAPPPPSSGPLATLPYIDTSYLDVQGSFEAYWEARGKNLRQNDRKQRNKLATEGITPVLECVSDPAGVAAALEDYGRLESKSWKAGGGTDIRADNAQGRFYREMLESFCARGRGRIYRYRFGEQVAAMDLCIDNGPWVVILKTAYDESHRSISPSALMRHEQFRQWWSEGRYQRIEFYGRTMEWHTRWTSSQRSLYHATAYRWPFLRSVHEQLRRRREAATAAAALSTPGKTSPVTPTAAPAVDRAALERGV